MGASPFSSVQCIYPFSSYNLSSVTFRWCTLVWAMWGVVEYGPSSNAMPNMRIMNSDGGRSKKRNISPTCGHHRCFHAVARQEQTGARSKFMQPFHLESPAPPPPLESRFLPQFPQICFLYSLYSSALSCHRSTRISQPEIPRSVLPSGTACCRSTVAWRGLTTSLPAKCWW